MKIFNIQALKSSCLVSITLYGINYLNIKYGDHYDYLFKKYRISYIEFFTQDIIKNLFENSNGKIILDGWQSLKSIEGLPLETKRLEILNCSSLESLNGVSSELKYLKLSRCNNLIDIKDIPDVMDVLLIDRCFKWKNIEELPLICNALMICPTENNFNMIISYFPKNVKKLLIPQETFSGIDYFTKCICDKHMNCEIKYYKY